MNWNIYSNREVTVFLWSDGSRNVFYSSDVKAMNDFVYRKKTDTLTFKIEKCMQSEYDVKYNGWCLQKDDL